MKLKKLGKAILLTTLVVGLLTGCSGEAKKIKL